MVVIGPVAVAFYERVALGRTKILLNHFPRYFRPTEVETLLGDPSKAKEKLGWTAKVSFKELVMSATLSDYSRALLHLISTAGQTTELEFVTASSEGGCYVGPSYSVRRRRFPVMAR